MATTLKAGVSHRQKQDDRRRVRLAVEDILAAVEQDGDSAVRRYSERFDHWGPDTFRLSDGEIDACVASLDPADVDDIRFAQDQVRAFAEAQKSALRDIEVETRPGVVLGHRNIPVDSVGCYVPGGKYPLVASAIHALAGTRNALPRR